MIKTSKLRMLGFGLLAAISLLVPSAIGQEKQTKEKGSEPAAQEAAQTVTINGKVSAVSETSVTVVDSKKAEKTITIDTNTKITKDGKEATAADIKAEDAVVVVAKADGAALTAVSIKIT